MKSNDNMNVAYVVDEDGRIPPKIGRISEIYGCSRGICEISSVLGHSMADIRNIARSLGFDRTGENYDDKGEKYTFQCEVDVREELLTIAKHLERLNVRLWASSRLLGNSAQSLAEQVIAESSAKDAEELEKFLKTSPVGVDLSGSETN